ncbi:MAG TPA: MATE family efflux transporter [Solirubrobacteraceae bacterium]|nr:MATE family efflux transporter [Solirubrobacteraceae bacterium]
MRSPHDREILRLAVPALGALASEPLYVLVDTAIVGHLGTTELAALAIAAMLLSSAFTVFNFLTYGTTAQVARLHGAGHGEQAARLGAQAHWLGLFIGVALALATLALAVPAVRLMGGQGAVGDGAITYLRIAALGAPCFMLASAGQGFLRGIGDLRTPLKILVAAHAVNVVLELLFVYGFGWGLAGSAWGTVIAQVGMAAAFVRVQMRAGWEPPAWARIRRLMRVGGEIAVRTTALLASFMFASAVLARVGAPSLAAHQIAFQLFVFIALVLDAVAIAGQVMVGRMLGAGGAAGARAASRRMIGWSVAFGGLFGLVLLALGDVIPHAFTSDPRVVERAQEMWPIFAAMMPVNGAVFALDGILIGAGDTRFLALGMIAASAVAIPLTVVALEAGWGIVGVWGALAALIGMRLLTCATRFAGQRWALTGALR